MQISEGCSEKEAIARLNLTSDDLHKVIVFGRSKKGLRVGLARTKEEQDQLLEMFGKNGNADWRRIIPVDIAGTNADTA